ncbi:MAG: class I SAM-dependent methyltransferase [bacterium]
MEKIKQHFEAEAREFDQIVQKLIPYYFQMVESLVAAIPFARLEPIDVIDLGCGTATVGKAIKDAHPCARITCIDLAHNMIEMARMKLADYADDICFQVGNFCDYEFDRTYDVAVSSLALHHLETNEDKKAFYGNIYENLRPGGVFYNADIVLGSSDYLQDMYLRKWKAFMNREASEEEIEKKWIPKYYEEDRPATLIEQIAWLREIGFSSVDVVWKYFNFAVYGGQKPKSG